jgi:N-acetylmuramoyl-L-alanine amidase
MSEPKTSRKAQLFSGLLLLFFTACPTEPKRASRVTPLPATVASERPAPAEAVAAENTPQPSPPEVSTPAAAAASEPEIAAEKKSSAEEAQEAHLAANEDPAETPAFIAPAVPSYAVGLTPLQDWLAESQQHFKLEQTASKGFHLATPQGQALLTLGSRFAKWNGMTLGLGFPPAFKGGKLCLHQLDLQKNFLPLLSPPLRKTPGVRTVVIDPGHGGENFGAKSAGSKLYEKDYTLDWALRVQRAMAGSNWRVILTRTNDLHLELLDRVALADAASADLFISLHFNSAPPTKNATESGMETFCLTPTGMPSNIVREFDDDPAKVFPNNVFDSENLIYAATLQQNLVQVTGRRDRGVRRARFMTVLREQKRPAVLVEGGFLSNAAEAQLINNPAFRQQLALAVRNSLLKLN